MIFRSSPGKAAFVVAVGALSAAAALMYELAPSALSSLATEDGPIEFATAILYFLAAGLCVRQLLRTDTGRGWWALLALAFFLVAGEEVSWGQRIFDFGTPDGLREDNVQGEFNLHNIDGISQTNRLVGIVFFLGYFVLTPVGVRLHDGVRRLAKRLRLPVPPLWLAPLVLFAVLLMAIPRALGSVVFNLDEVGEFDLALTALAFLIVAATAEPSARPFESRAPSAA